MSTLTWVAIAVVAYWLVAVSLDRSGLLPPSVRVQGPLTTLHTQRGKAVLDRLARYRRFWRAWANVGVGIALVVMAASFAFLLVSALFALRNPQPSAVSQPRNVLVIPGVNDFLPLEVAPEIVLGLLVGLVVHEGGHGLLCRVEDIEIDSMGVALFTLIPVGAFVEPDEDSQAAADRGGRTRMFAAGVTNNFAITILAFALLFGPVAGSIAVADGAAVGGAFPGSPASEADIEAGDRITAVQGQSVGSNDDLTAALAATEEREVTVRTDDGTERTVTRSVFVTGAVPDAPPGVEAGWTIREVEDEQVYTTAAFREAVSENERVTVVAETGDGERIERTFPAGAYAIVAPDGALSEAGAPAEAEVVIVAIEGERIAAAEDLTSALAETSPGDEITVDAYVEGERESFEVTLGGDGDRGVLGVGVASGVSGMDVDDFGVQYYPAGTYLSLLGGDGDDAALLPGLTDSFVGKTVAAVVLPVASVFGDAFPYNFAGFTGDVTNFYTVVGPLSALGGGVFVAANVLFWIGWLNVNLAFFNCVPAFPLDGGHILRTSTEAVVSRLPVDASYELTKLVTVSVGVTMLASFVLLIFGPQLLS